MPGTDAMMSAPLAFHDLGPLLVERAGELLPVRGRRLTAAVSVLLVHANHRVSADALVDAVWGDAPAANATSTLESHLWRLRRILEPGRRRGEPFTSIVHDQGGYRLAVAADQVDSLRLGTMVGQTRDLLVSDQPARALARADEGLRAWRGEPWTPHTDEDWAVASVGRLREQLSQLQELRVQALLAVGDAATALTDLEPLIAAEPLREQLWAMSMVAAYRAGRVQQALDTFARARAVLVEEAGIEPGAELQQLQRQVLQRDAGLDAADAAATRRIRLETTEVHLPTSRGPLVGREAELAQLAVMVPAERLVSVVGPAGCGKTVLAVEAAATLSASFPDGVWFVDLIGATGADQLLDLLTGGLGLAAVEAGDPVVAVRAFTRSRRMLLVLDNCEHILDEVAELVVVLLDGGSELTVLATSREPLVLEDERVLDLRPLAGPGDGSGGVGTSPAVQLFLQRWRSASGFDVAGPDDLALAAEICEQVDGLPLAIELAAGQGRGFGLAEIAERVRQDPAGLARIGRRGSRSHHDTLHAAIDLSIATLTSAELDVHRAVAVVPGPFTVDLAARLADVPRWAAASSLGNLVHRSMLSSLGPRTPGAPSRFVQLATLRSHGLTTATAANRDEATRRRDLWVRDLAADAPRIGRPDSLAWFSRLDDDLPAIRATLQHTLVDVPDPIGPFVVVRIGMYCFYRGLVVEWERWTRLASSVASDDFERLLLRASHAAAAGLVGREQRYDSWFDQLEAFPRPLSVEEQVELGEYLLVVCLTLWATGEFRTGERALRTMATIAADTGDPTVTLFAEVARLILAAQTEAPSTLLPAVAAAYQRCLDPENHLGAWVAASAGTISCLIGRSPVDGLVWADRLQHHFGQLGGGTNGIGLELRGTLLAQAGRFFEALSVLARSRALAVRAGQAWPTLPSTPEVLTAVESQLSAADTDRAYLSGALRSPAGEVAAP